MVTGQYSPSIFPNESESMAKHSLFEKLIRYPALLNEDPSLPVFYNNYNNTVISGQTNLMLSMEELNQYDSTYSSMLLFTDSIISIVNDSLSALQSLPSSPQIIAAISSLVLQHQNLQSAFDNLTQQLNATRQNQLQNLVLKNSAILPVELPEINEQVVNEIYFHTIALGITNFTPEQINQLSYIANQCPFSGGPAVFRARVMFEYIDPLIEYDDETTCLAQGIYRIAQQNVLTQSAISFQIKPNPATDNVTITYSAIGETSCKLRIEDMAGRQIKYIELPANFNSYTFSINDINNGIYLINLVANDALIGKNKLIVIH